MANSTAGSLMLDGDVVARWDSYRDGTVQVHVVVDGIAGARIGSARVVSGGLSEQSGKRVTARDWARVQGAIDAQIKAAAAADPGQSSPRTYSWG
jgi:hypothetical protein